MANQLTEQQLKIIQEKIKPIFEHLERKKALELARALEARVVNLETTDPELYKKYQKLIAQLKWVACPLIRDEQEFLELVEKYFLEGLELDVNLIDLVTAKLELQFGVNLRESINEILVSLRNNKQKLGANPIQAKEELTPVEPLLKNWLLDFIRSAKAKNPAKIEETDYLFNNQNAKRLSESDKKTLGKILAFYDIFKLYANGLALREKMVFPATPSAPTPPLTKPAIPNRPSPSSPTQPPALEPIRPIPSRRDIYQESIEEPLRPGQVEPRIEGNVVDLKNR